MICILLYGCSGSMYRRSSRFYTRRPSSMPETESRLELHSTLEKLDCGISKQYVVYLNQPYRIHTLITAMYIEYIKQFICCKKAFIFRDFKKRNPIKMMLDTVPSKLKIKINDLISNSYYWIFNVCTPIKTIIWMIYNFINGWGTSFTHSRCSCRLELDGRSQSNNTVISTVVVSVRCL